MHCGIVDDNVINANFYYLAENIHCVIEDDNVIDAYFSVQTASECQVGIPHKFKPFC